MVHRFSWLQGVAYDEAPGPDGKFKKRGELRTFIVSQLRERIVYYSDFLAPREAGAISADKISQ
jgi:hypothetical protein